VEASKKPRITSLETRRGREDSGDTSASMRQVSARDINGLVLVSESVEDGLQVIRPGIPVSL